MITTLYPNGIKGADKLCVQDLRQLAKFNKIVLNSLKMDALIENNRKNTRQ